MKNLIVEKKVNVTATFDPVEWGTDDQEIADKLNNRFEFYVNKGYSKEEVLRSMYKVLSQYNLHTDYGLTFLNDIVDFIYWE